MTPRGPEEPIENRYRANPFIWVIPLILSGIGILMITSTTSPNSFVLTGTPFQTGLRQLRWLAIAMCGMFFVYSVPVRIWKRFSAPLLILMWLLSWLPLVPGIGDTVGGASRWIRLPGLGVSLQPGELLALSLALHVAKLLSRDGDRDPLKTFGRILFLVTFAALPLLMQPDLGTTILVFTVVMGMYVERIGWRYPLFAGGFVGGVIFPLLIWLEPYRMRRVFAFLDPWEDPLNRGFQAIQGLIAFANGGAWGAGLGHGFQKLNYLPAAYTDFIFAAIGEELGFVGTACVLAPLRLLDASGARDIFPYARRFQGLAHVGHISDDFIAAGHKRRRSHEDDTSDGNGAAVHQLRRNVAGHDVGARRTDTAARKGQLSGG